MTQRPAVGGQPLPGQPFQVIGVDPSPLLRRPDPPISDGLAREAVSTGSTSRMRPLPSARPGPAPAGRSDRPAAAGGALRRAARAEPRPAGPVRWRRHRGRGLAVGPESRPSRRTGRRRPDCSRGLDRGSTVQGGVERSGSGAIARAGPGHGRRATCWWAGAGEIDRQPAAGIGGRPGPGSGSAGPGPVPPGRPG